MGWVGLDLNISGLGWVKENQPTANSAAFSECLTYITLVHYEMTKLHDDI